MGDSNKIYFTTNNYYGQHILYTWFHSAAWLVASRKTAVLQHLQVTCGNARKLFQCPINSSSSLSQYVPTAFLGSLSHTCSLPTAMW